MIKKASILLFALAGTCLTAGAQRGSRNNQPKPAAPTPAPGGNNGGFTKTPRGMQYKFITDAPGSPAQTGDQIVVHVRQFVDDSLFFDSHAQPGGQPAQVQIQPPQFNGDIAEGLVMLSAGDKAVLRMPIDSIPVPAGQSLPPMFKGHRFLDFEVDVQAVKNRAQVEAEQQAAQAEQQRRIQEMQAREASQGPVDDSLIRMYLKKKGIKNFKRTPSGLYYVITKMGTGPKPATGDKVNMNYTGRTTIDTVFDSNVLPSFGHVQPFEFGLGQGQVIKGWDEGIAMLPKGSKATLFIPSQLAYGSQSPSPKIPPFSVLVFDVEVMGITKSTTPPVDVMPTPQPRQ